MKIAKFLILLLFFASNCFSQNKRIKISEYLKESPSITGKQAYLDSPFVTAGSRIYMVGHQNGSFPELGWHIPGEMGGIWNHPIKLLDGFQAELVIENDTLPLSNAVSFNNYPIASRQTFKLEDYKLEIERWNFVPENQQSLVVQFIIRNKSSVEKNFDFHFKAFSDLRPTWLGKEAGMIDSKDRATYNTNEDYYVIKDSINPWSVVYKSDRKSDFRTNIQSVYQGQGVGNLLGYSLSLPPDESKTISFFLAGSYKSVSETLDNLRYIENNFETEIHSKKVKYQKIADRSRLTIPDKKMQEAFEWLKYNSAWLVQKVPEIGTGITAGIPDYPWWFGVDSEYALKGYMAVGQTEPVYSTIRLLDSVSEAVNGNGRIIHEMSTNGVVFNKGNINETPQFASLIWDIYKWNGDKEFLKKYYPTIKKGLWWLMMENDENNNLFPDGFGMMEIHGLDSEMIDVAAYSQRAYADAAKIAHELNDNPFKMEYLEIASDLKEKINEEFWSEEFGSYADFIGTDEQALKLIEDAIVRADTLDKPWSVEELKRTKKFIENNPSKNPRPFVLHHNWVVNTPMEMKIADSAKAEIALRTAEKYTNPFGVFVTGIDRDEQVSTEEESFKGSKAFSYTGAVMTLPTGVQAIAENNYGNPDKALDYLKRMTRSFSFAFPGSMYEVSPDYGMITQAWNIYSFAIPIVQQFFGIQPMASEKTVTIQPQMPTEWNEASLENVLMADNEVSVFYKRSGNTVDLEIVKINASWKVIIPYRKGYRLVSSNLTSEETSEKKIISKENTLKLKFEKF